MEEARRRLLSRVGCAEATPTFHARGRVCQSIPAQLHSPKPQSVDYDTSVFGKEMNEGSAYQSCAARIEAPTRMGQNLLRVPAASFVEREN